jgi:hypothetical protein
LDTYLIKATADVLQLTSTRVENKVCLYSFDLVPRLKENLSCPVLQGTLKENKVKIFKKENFFKRCWLIGHLLAIVLYQPIIRSCKYLYQWEFHYISVMLEITHTMQYRIGSDHPLPYIGI